MITKEFPVYVVQLALEEYLNARNESFDIDAQTDHPEVHYFTKNKEGSHYDKKSVFLDEGASISFTFNLETVEEREKTDMEIKIDETMAKWDDAVEGLYPGHALAK
jgi:hypothetical protein